ncbi:MAG: transposase [Candidatus Sungbacteria bacterium]|nr:transposase [Candidatus Sungbacteria bacterium]
MVYQKRNFVAGEIYHVINRGVDKRKLFLNDKDYLRFIHDLFEFNDTEPADNVNYFFGKNPVFAKDVITKKQKSRELLVEILAFSLMPNHYHLLLRPRFDDGIVRFMKKLNMGYSLYFNEKYVRSGALFQGRYKSILVTNERHFIYLPYYIHLNPLDLAAPEWRDHKLKNHQEAIQFLDSYRWSSHLDYAGKKNFPSVTQRDFLVQCFGNSIDYRQNLEQWLKELDLTPIKKIILE